MIRFSLLLAISFIATALSTATAQPKMVEVWRTKTPLQTPESVLYDQSKDRLFVSCIDGTPDGKDGKGAIALVSKEGIVLNPDWVKGLNAPKGMAMVGNLLYVSDISDIVIIDISKATVQKRIAVEGAAFLNDITADNAGAVYVSDSKTGKVHRLMGAKVETYLEGLQGPNGLLFVMPSLYVLASGKLFEYGPDKQPKQIAEGMDASTDGLELTGPGEFVASCWAGAVYHIKDGKASLMLDTREQKSNTADIGYNPKSKMVYVPTFFKHSVVAYGLR